MRDEPILRPRLQAVAEQIQMGGRVIDVGTDHALLPISLVKQGRVSAAIAADIEEAPLERGRINIEKYGLSNRIALQRTDGLSGITLEDGDHIVIAGMGGELIARILENAPALKHKDIRLILQPMTRANVLRAYLANNGFRIERETLVNEDRIYQIITASYDGVRREVDEFLCLYGEGNLNPQTEEHRALCLMHLKRLQEVYLERQNGKKLAGALTAEEDAILARVLQVMEELHDNSTAEHVF